VQIGNERPIVKAKKAPRAFKIVTALRCTWCWYDVRCHSILYWAGPAKAIIKFHGANEYNCF